jgi:hypothetical protein
MPLFRHEYRDVLQHTVNVLCKYITQHIIPGVARQDLD